nr:MAG TPA: hypothetical protein [Inoviridae sp.]
MTVSVHSEGRFLYLCFFSLRGIPMSAGIQAINLHWLRLCKFMFFAYLVFLLTMVDLCFFL